jgi:FOG: GGDEF domain
VLQEVAQAISETCRAIPTAPAAMAARNSWYCWSSPTSRALLMAQRLCDAVYSRVIVHATSPLRVVTISVGVATLEREHHRRVEDVLNAADAALYRAKRDGRNAVRVSGVD